MKRREKPNFTPPPPPKIKFPPFNLLYTTPRICSSKTYRGRRGGGGGGGAARRRRRRRGGSRGGGAARAAAASGAGWPRRGGRCAPAPPAPRASPPGTPPAPPSPLSAAQLCLAASLLFSPPVWLLWTRNETRRLPRRNISFPFRKPCQILSFFRRACVRVERLMAFFLG